MKAKRWTNTYHGDQKGPVGTFVCTNDHHAAIDTIGGNRPYQ